MSKYTNNEFKDVQHGLPPVRKTPKGFNYLLLFFIVGVLLALVILILQSALTQSSDWLMNLTFGYVLEQALITSVLSLLVGSVQAWIFKARISSRIPLFVGFALIGGVVGGTVGGFIYYSGIKDAFVIGAINGGIASAVSSLFQNRIMGNVRYASRWLTYSILSWSVIYSIGWVIGWDRYNVGMYALAGAFLVIASGIGLTIFLNRTPQIEFN